MMTETRPATAKPTRTISRLRDDPRYLDVSDATYPSSDNSADLGERLEHRPLTREQMAKSPDESIR
jgi:hypothetical protein